MNLERISAITINVNSMARSVHFYSRLLGLKVLYGGENAYFSSLQTLGAKDTILNLSACNKTSPCTILASGLSARRNCYGR